MAGLLTAGGVHTAKAAARPVLNVGTAGVAAPVVSTVEDGLSLVATLLALLAPLLILVLIAAVAWGLARLWRRRSQKAGQSRGRLTSRRNRVSSEPRLRQAGAVAREERVRADGTVECLVNDRAVATSAPASTVALDFLRAHERLSGVKEGCREGDCGACTVLLGELRGDHVDYRAVCSCLLPIGDAHGKHLVTVEGLTRADGLSPVQRLLVDEGGVQCGFCTPGFVVSLTGYLLSGAALSGDAAVESVGGNLCRCTGHVPIVRAARRLVDTARCR